ncbi:protein phosphatase 2C-like protein [Chloropicon roscoffensis]|uniref:Protein phosphatase n=2 Tax=Chloropicon roscoffensis TaxID=1461544 RepID=A0AAX4P427_9CHLO
MASLLSGGSRALTRRCSFGSLATSSWGASWTARDASTTTTESEEASSPRPSSVQAELDRAQRRRFHFNAFYTAKSTAGARAARAQEVPAYDDDEDDRDGGGAVEGAAGSDASIDTSMETVVAGVSHSFEDRYEYRVEVHTGELRGAGTTSNVYINLVGNLHQTGRCLLRSPDEEGEDEVEEFKTGSNKTFNLLAPNLLGRISGIELSLDATEGAGEGEGEKPGASGGGGWYVEKLIVYSPTGKRLEFPCKCWFGRSDCGAWGPQRRKLIPFVQPLTERLTSFGKILPKQLSIDTGAFVAPHPDKVRKGVKAKSFKEYGHAGEDAYFKCYSKTGLVFGMGVADGVYMWSEQGIDAGEFSKALMSHAREEVAGSSSAASVTDIIKKAADNVKQDSLRGSSTLCCCLVDMVRGTAQIANLGDSGVVILGSGGVKFKTPQQEHSFGYPFQVGHQEHSDRPEDALQSVVALKAGDVVVVGTDGLFDNLSEEDAVQIAGEVRKQLEGKCAGEVARRLANELGRRAFQNSMDKWIETPYSKAATDAFDMVYSGGKKDDITIIVSVVS